MSNQDNHDNQDNQREFAVHLFMEERQKYIIKAESHERAVELALAGVSMPVEYDSTGEQSYNLALVDELKPNRKSDTDYIDGNSRWLPVGSPAADLTLEMADAKYLSRLLARNISAPMTEAEAERLQKLIRMVNSAISEGCGNSDNQDDQDSQDDQSKPTPASRPQVSVIAVVTGGVLSDAYVNNRANVEVLFSVIDHDNIAQADAAEEQEIYEGAGFKDAADFNSRIGSEEFRLAY